MFFCRNISTFEKKYSGRYLRKTIISGFSEQNPYQKPSREWGVLCFNRAYETTNINKIQSMTALIKAKLAWSLATAKTSLNLNVGSDKCPYLGREYLFLRGAFSFFSSSFLPLFRFSVFLLVVDYDSHSSRETHQAYTERGSEHEAHVPHLKGFRAPHTTHLTHTKH